MSFRPKCGRRNLDGVNVKIFRPGGDGKHSTQFGEWPNMCAIYISKEGTNASSSSYLAGASLIAPGIVITVTHHVMYCTSSAHN